MSDFGRRKEGKKERRKAEEEEEKKKNPQRTENNGEKRFNGEPNGSLVRALSRECRELNR